MWETLVNLYSYDFVVDGIYYNITSSSNLTVEVTYQNVYSGWYYDEYHCTYVGNIVIPETVIYDGIKYQVTGIGENAFATSPSSNLKSYMHNLKSIILPSSIKTIGESAFYMCDEIKTLVVPASVESIGHNSFWCRGCENIVFLSATPPRINSTETNINIPCEVWVSNKNSYKNWDRTKDNFWGGLVEMLSPSTCTFVYNGISPSVSWTNNLSAYTMNVSDVSLKRDAGDYSVNVTVGFYKDGTLAFFAEFQYEYTIQKAKLTVKADKKNREYGNDNPIFTLSYNGFVNNETLSVINEQPKASTTATKFSVVGEYAINVTGGFATNYDFVYEPGTLTITKASLTAKVKDNTKMYGSRNPTFSIEYNGLKNSETEPTWTTKPSFQTEATQSSVVGSYTVSASGGNPENYVLTAITPGTLNIIPAPLTVIANSVSKDYYTENPEFSYSCRGLMSWDSYNIFSVIPVLTTNANLTSNVGSYDIVVSGASAVNYDVSFINGTLTINPRTLKASVGNYERKFNEENPSFLVVYNGFVGNEDESVLTSKAVAKTAATKLSDVGTYSIDVIGGEAANYKFSYSSGKLTINKAEQIIVWEQDFESGNCQVGDQIELLAYATSGLPINYVLNDSNIAAIYTANGKVYLDCLQEGTLVIRALQDGNNNYYTAVRKSKTLSIGNSSSIENISIEALSSDAPVYDLMGKIVKILLKGRVYTQNGKKFIAK